MAPKSSIALLVAILHLLSIELANSNGDGFNVIDITKYGVKHGGDATEAIAAAWWEACASTSPSKVIVPRGSYTLYAVAMRGPCKAKIKMEILGNFTAPPDPKDFKGSDTWVKFEKVDGLTLIAPQGSGMFDGQGRLAWQKNNCVQLGKCGSLPYNLRFNFVRNSVISGITSMNSKLFHIQIQGCRNLSLDQVHVSAPKESVNTDGIVIRRSEDVNIRGSRIETGDDCISVVDGTKNLRISNVTCGPGLGISVGSLGKIPNEAPVEGITVEGCTIKDTDNGVRVKTWQNSYKNQVTGLRFENIIVHNVWYPIIVDQEYCPYNHCTRKTPSKVKLSNMVFKNVTGTASKKEAVKLVCSESTPCEKVELIDIDLEYKGNDGPAESICKNIKPFTSGKQAPPICTVNHDAPPSHLDLDTQAIETNDV